MSGPHPSIPVTYVLIDREHLRALVALIDWLLGPGVVTTDEQGDALDAARKAVGE